MEEGTDYTLVNEKSKELFMSYSDIFSYVGTYKALVRAIRFLGYNDIVFKEWYALKDSNDKLTDVAIQVFDTSEGTFFASKLKEYGISVEEFNNYNKLNKISMIYHLCSMDDDGEWQNRTKAKYNPNSGKIELGATTKFLMDIP